MIYGQINQKESVTLGNLMSENYRGIFPYDQKEQFSLITSRFFNYLVEQGVLNKWNISSLASRIIEVFFYKLNFSALNEGFSAKLIYAKFVLRKMILSKCKGRFPVKLVPTKLAPTKLALSKVILSNGCLKKSCPQQSLSAAKLVRSKLVSAKLVRRKACFPQSLFSPKLVLTKAFPGSLLCLSKAYL